jgi:hypothetical protein
MFARKVREVPVDPNEGLVSDIYKTFPYGAAPFGVRSMIQMMVHVILELKKRGLI